MDALMVEQVQLDYPGRPGVLRRVALRVPKGQVVVLQGRSGSGKSSLLAVAAGLERPTRGRVLVNGKPMPHDMDEAAKVRESSIGMVFQHLNLLGELTVAENVELPLRFRKVPRKERAERVDAVLRLFGIHDLAGRLPSRLSGGEQQRVAIARALATKPDLLLVDEPTSSLDAENAAQVVEALRRAAQAGAGVLVATHDDVFQDFETVLHIDDGTIRRKGGKPRRARA